MQFQYQHDRNSKEAIFFSVENAVTQVTPDVPTILKGQLTAWDVTDYTGTAGILANTRGLRVIVYPAAEAGDAVDGLKRQAGFATTDMLGPVTANSRNSQMYLIQVYGFCNFVLADTDAASDIIAGGGLVPSGDAAGKVEGYQISTAPTVNELNKTVGMAFAVTAVNTTATIEAIVNTLR